MNAEAKRLRSRAVAILDLLEEGERNGVSSSRDNARKHGSTRLREQNYGYPKVWPAGANFRSAD